MTISEQIATNKDCPFCLSKKTHSGANPSWPLCREYICEDCGGRYVPLAGGGSIFCGDSKS